MNLFINGHDINCYFQIEKIVPSKFTEKELKEAKIDFNVRSKVDYDYINEYLSENKILNLKNQDGSIENWEKINYSSRYTEGRELYSFSVDIKEYEILKIELLEVDNFKVKPIKYLEEIEKDALIISAIIVGDTEYINNFRKLMLTKSLYFNVKRNGISDIIKRMRFGRLYNWCLDDSGNIIQSFTLVEESYDKEKQINLIPIDQVGILISENIVIKNKLDYIFKKFKENSILNEEDTNEIDRLEKENYETDYFNYYQTKSFEYVESFFKNV